MFFSAYGMIVKAIYTFFQTLIYVVPALLIAISMHEFAHGYMSYLLGDPTPKMDGRLTLNPFRHLDVWGTLCLLVFHVGWAKPIRWDHRAISQGSSRTAYFRSPTSGIPRLANWTRIWWVLPVRR